MAVSMKNASWFTKKCHGWISKMMPWIGFRLLDICKLVLNEVVLLPTQLRVCKSHFLMAKLEFLELLHNTILATHQQSYKYAKMSVKLCSHRVLCHLCIYTF